MDGPKVYDPCTVSLRNGGGLFLAGGYDGNVVSEKAFVYDMAERKWTPVADMPTPRHGNLY